MGRATLIDAHALAKPTLWISETKDDSGSGFRYPQGLWAVWRSAPAPKACSRPRRPCASPRGCGALRATSSTIGTPPRSTCGHSTSPATVHRPDHEPPLRATRQPNHVPRAAPPDLRRISNEDRRSRSHPNPHYGSPKPKNSGLWYPQGLWAVWRSAPAPKACSRPRRPCASPRGCGVLRATTSTIGMPPSPTVRTLHQPRHRPPAPTTRPHFARLTNPTTCPAPRFLTFAEIQTPTLSTSGPPALSPTPHCGSPKPKQKLRALVPAGAVGGVEKREIHGRHALAHFRPRRFSKGLWSAPRNNLDDRHASITDCADTPPAPPPSIALTTSPVPPDSPAQIARPRRAS